MVTVQLTDELVAVLNRSDQPLDRRAQELIVLELYRQAEISSGKAAEILGMSRIDFIKYSGQLGIPFIHMNDDEWKDEVARIDAWTAER